MALRRFGLFGRHCKQAFAYAAWIHIVDYLVFYTCKLVHDWIQLNL